MPITSAPIPKIIVVPASDEPATEAASQPMVSAPRALRPKRASAAASAVALQSIPREPADQRLEPPPRRRARTSARAHSPERPSMPHEAGPSASQSLSNLAGLLDHLGAVHQAPQVAQWPIAQQQMLQRYLKRLLTAEAARGSDTCQVLKLRLQRLLSNACLLPHFRLRALSELQAATDTYGDRLIRGLDDIELSLSLEQISAMPTPEATLSLVLLGVSVMRLLIVRNWAAETSSLLPQVSASEIAFHYEAHLRERLDLPGFTAAPKEDFVLPKECLDAAARLAEAMSANTEIKRRFFDGWIPWQQLRRRQKIRLRSYAGLQVQHRRPLQLDGICAITSRAERHLAQPVYLDVGDEVQVFEYEALMAWWVAHGTQPATGEVLELDSLWRKAV